MGDRTVIPKNVVAEVLARDKNSCVLNLPGCAGEATCADHRVGRGMGGNKKLDVVYALVAACSFCNSLRESDADAAASLEARGIKLRRSASTIRDLHVALTTPVRYPDGRLLFLTVMGGVSESVDPPF